MRDAFGGSFMIMIFLVFIMVYISFTAVALSYAKAFKVKNAVIDFLEEWEVDGLKNIPADKMAEFESFIDSEIVGNKNYNMSNDRDFCKNNSKKGMLCSQVGIVISQSEPDERTRGFYYTVYTYVGWDIGFFSKLAALNGDKKDPEVGDVTGTWKISGQTRLIVNK